MDATLPVRIVEARPSTLYLGQVYEQDVVLAVDDAVRFDVFDPDMRVFPPFVGTTRDVELVAFCADVAHAPGTERDIQFEDESGPVFLGRVTELDTGDGSSDGVLDVGAGTIRFSPDEADEPVSVGDYLQITRAAVHLTAMEGERRYDDRYEEMLTWLTEGGVDERRTAARYLGERGSERGLDHLVERLRTDDDPTVRAEAATALGRIGMAARKPGDERDPRIERELEEAATDESEDEDVVAETRLALDDIEKSDRDHHHSRDW